MDGHVIEKNESIKEVENKTYGAHTFGYTPDSELPTTSSVLLPVSSPYYLPASHCRYA